MISGDSCTENCPVSQLVSLVQNVTKSKCVVQCLPWSLWCFPSLQDEPHVKQQRLQCVADQPGTLDHVFCTYCLPWPLRCFSSGTMSLHLSHQTPKRLQHAAGQLDHAFANPVPLIIPRKTQLYTCSMVNTTQHFIDP